MMDQACSQDLALAKLTRKLDLDSLRLFAVVCEEGSYAKATWREPLSPSAISKRILELERALGLTLLERPHTGLKPTPTGALLIRQWHEIAESLVALLPVRAPSAQPDGPRVRIVADAESARFLVFDCLAHLDAKDDASRIAVHASPLGQLAIDFEAQSSDVAIWAFARGYEPERQQLFTRLDSGQAFTFNAEICVAVVRREHPLVRDGLMMSDQLQPYPVVSVAGVQDPVEQRIRQMNRRGLHDQAQGARPSWSYQMGSALEFLDSAPTETIALLPTSVRYLMHRYPALCCLPLEDALGCGTFGCVIRRGRALPRISAELERLTGCPLQAASVVDVAEPAPDANARLNPVADAASTAEHVASFAQRNPGGSAPDRRPLNCSQVS